MMKRSPRTAVSGDSRRICTSPESPAASPAAPPRTRTRAREVAVPTWRWTRSSSWTGPDAHPSTSSRASSIRVALNSPGEATTDPRSTARRPPPARFSAHRCPACADSTEAPWTWSPRTRARSPSGRTSTSLPAATRPDTSVPVTTEPKPRMVKARSTGSRKGPEASRAPAAPAAAASAPRSSSSPAPVFEETGTRGASDIAEPASSSRTSRAAISMNSGSSTRSIRVSATTAERTPSSRQISMCSRVWGITDSSAATTSSTTSKPEAPASMLRTNRSWPGTSTKP